VCVRKGSASSGGCPSAKSPVTVTGARDGIVVIVIVTSGMPPRNNATDKL